MTPLKTADPDALRETALVCQRELGALTADESVWARVRRVTLVKRDGMPSLEVTARMLHMTPCTLHRRLVNEGASFRGITLGITARGAHRQPRRHSRITGRTVAPRGRGWHGGFR